MRALHNSQGEVIAAVSTERELVHATSLKLESVADATSFQRLVDIELRVSGTRLVLLDAREATLSSTEMNESMWRWVGASSDFDRLAIVNRSPVLSVAAKMKATAIGTKKVMVFHDFQAAVRWLLTH